MFKKSSFYTRDEIHGQLGGSKQWYLPTVNGQVVAACFKKTDDMNPNAPEVILPGTGKIIESTAKQFTKQGVAIPTFIKITTGQWEYIGNFKVSRQSFDLKEIKIHSKNVERKDKVTSVLFLTEEK
jgi:hypothetical protein